jgi:hypothetical protein
MFTMLARALGEAGQAIEPYQSPDGSRLLVLPYGARVLALAAPDCEDSFFWANPLLQQADTARALFAGAGWHNTGGDRTWLAPELDVFFPDAKADRYLQPRALDMSPYAVQRAGGGLELSRRLTLHLARPNRDVALRLTKWLGPAAHPLRHERDLAGRLAGIRYAGYTQRTTLEFLGSPADTPALGIWNLLQLPPGGEMLVPWYAPVAPQTCFGQIPPESVHSEDRLLRVRVDFPGSHKIALRATAVCGRAGYLWQRSGQWSLVIRNFFLNPSGEYVDVQKHDPDDRGYGFQLCRVDEPALGSFCELEYHAPALGAPPDPARSDDLSHVWAFAGAYESIATVAQRLLGAA